MDEGLDLVQKNGVADEQKRVSSDEIHSVNSMLEQYEHSPSTSLDGNQSAGASKSSQSFGARFNKIPKSLSIHENTKSGGPAIGTFRVGGPPRQSQAHLKILPKHQEQSTYTPIATEHQDLPEWRRLPEPSQSGHSELPSQLTRLPSLKNMVDEDVPHHNPPFSQAAHHLPGFTGGTFGAVTNRTPLAGIPVGYQHFAGSHHVNPTVPHASGLEVHQDVQNTQGAGAFIIRSDWSSSQEMFRGYARHEPGPLHPVLTNANGSLGGAGVDIDPNQAEIRRSYHQFLRQQSKSADKQNPQTRHDTVNHGDSHQQPMLGKVQPFGPGMFPAFPATQQGQVSRNTDSRGNTPNPTMSNNQPGQYLISPALSIPDTSPLTPTFLDPVLFPQTYEAMLQRYEQNRVVINLWITENERYFADFSSRFRSQQQVLDSLKSPRFAPSIDSRPGTQLPNKQGSSQDQTHYAPTSIYQAQEQVGQPMSGPPSREIRGPVASSAPYFSNAESQRSRTASPHVGSRQKAPHVSSGLREMQTMQQSPPKAHKKRSSVHSTTNLSKDLKSVERKAKEGLTRSGTPSQNEKLDARAAKEKSSLCGKIIPKKSHSSRLENSADDDDLAHDKTSQAATSAYEAEIAAADLPPPSISDAALRAAGITPKSKLKEKSDKQSSGKRRDRTGKKFPAGGLRVPESMRSALLAGGAQDLTPTPSHTATQPTSAATIGFSNAQGGTQIAPASSSVYSRVPNHQTQNSPTVISASSRQLSETSLRTRIAKTDDRRARKEKDEIQKRAPTQNPFRDTNSSASISPDDPRDRDYGARATGGRKAATASPATVYKEIPSRSHQRRVSQASLVPSKRRSSAAFPETVGKRSCQDIKMKENEGAERAVSEPPSSGGP